MPVTAMAVTGVKNCPELSHFNIAAYRSCRLQSPSCSISEQKYQAHAFCVATPTNDQLSCRQASKLASLLQVPLSSIEVTSELPLTVVKINYLADGAERYYIITPTGQLVQTDIDPRQIDTELAHRYANDHWLIVNDGQPHYYRHYDGSHGFTATVKIMNGCRACRQIATAVIVWHLDRYQKVTTVALQKFRSNS